jgi:hypothetical protein
MDFGMMARVYPAAAKMAELAGSRFDVMSELLHHHRYVLYRLMSACAGCKSQEIPEMDAGDTLSALLDAMADGLLTLIYACRSAGPEIVCTTLYQYRPEDPAALVTLINRRRKDDRCTYYMADALRLLVLSNLKKGSKYPRLEELLSNKKVRQTQSGEQILDSIITAVTGTKGE